MTRTTVGKRRQRFVELRVDGLQDEPRSSAPRTIEDERIRAIIRACPRTPALAYNTVNFMRTPALSESVKHWSLNGLREKLIKIGAKIVTHARYVAFQMAEITASSQLFEEILRISDALRRDPA